MQCTGHAPLLQALDSISEPHGMPPWAAAIMTLRARDLVPDSHDTEHDVHVVQMDAAQSTGHAGTLQASCWESTGQALPS